MKAFVLAGGFATRLWPLTEKRAKPLLPLALKPLLTWLVERVPEGMPITLSTNQVFAEDFEKWKRGVTRHSSERHSIDDRNRVTSDEKSRDVNILIEDAGHEDEKLGALGAVAKWIREENIEEDVLLLAGDNYVGFSLRHFVQRFTGKPLLAAYDIRDREQAKKFGIVVAENEPLPTTGAYRVRDFQEKPAHPQSTLVSTGCSILPADVLPTIFSYAQEHPDNIGGIFEHFLAEGIDVQCVSYAEPWFDIGSFEAYLEATKAIVRENKLLGEGAECTNTSCEGSIVLGKGSTVSRSTLHNVVVFEDCHIEDCVLESCVIDNQCTLKGVDLTKKMLREGTKLLRS